MTKDDPKINNGKGAIALLTVIIVTSVALVFVVSLAIMNLDYSLTSGSLLFNRELSTAVDGCLDSAIGDLRSSSSAVTLLNVNDIGPSNIDCQVDIATTGNKKFLRARASSTSAFYNTVMRATSTVDFSTNPITVNEYQTQVDASTNTMASSGIVNADASASGNTSRCFSIDGNYAYVVFRDSAYSNKLSIAKVNLSTMTSESVLHGLTPGDSLYYDSVVHRGYLYVAYHISSVLNVLRVDLNNFVADGVTVMSGAPSVTVYTPYNSPIAAEGDYVYVAFGDAGNSNKLGMWRISVNDFTSTGITARASINAAYARYLDLDINNGLAYVTAGSGTFSGKSGLFKFAVGSNFEGSAVSSVSGGGAGTNAYNSSTLSGDYVYLVGSDGGDSFNIHIKKIDVNSMSVVGDIDTNVYAWTSEATVTGNYLYVDFADNAAWDHNIYQIDLRDFTISQILMYDSDLDALSRPKILVSGLNIYFTVRRFTSNLHSIVKYTIN